MTKFIQTTSVILTLVLILALPSCTHKHLYESTVTPHTCTEQGYTTYTCSCGDSYVADYVEAAHSFGEWVVIEEDTPQENGIMERYCPCGAVESTMDR